MKKYHLLFFVTFLLILFWGIPIQDVQASNEISLDVAKQAALNELKQSPYAGEIDSVDNFTLKTYLYDVDESLLGYYLTYKTGEGNTNHILVSATTDRTPILQYGEGILDSEYEYLLDKGKKLYYLGPLQFLYGKDNNEVIGKFNQSKAMMLKDLEKENKLQSQDYEKLLKKDIPSVKKDIKNIEEWNKLLSYDPSNQFSTLATTYKVLGVTRIWQRSSGVNSPNSACGPATAAMVANYLKGQGYNVKGTADYSSVGAFINHMYSDLGTNAVGTSMAQYVSGLRTHVRENYTATKWETWSYRAYGYYEHYKDMINLNKPVGLRFDFFVREGTYVDYHFVAGIGYDHGSVAKFAVKDPDGGSGNTGTIWLNWNDNNNDMAMGLVNYIN